VLLLAIAATVSSKEYQTSQEVSEGVLHFTTGFFKQMSSDTESNLVFSPLGLHSALSMLYQGATGSTKRSLTNVLQIRSAEVAAQGYAEVINHLNSLYNVEINVANKIFYSDQKRLNAAFADVNTASFFSEVEPVYLQKNAVDTVNRWVRAETRDEIDDLLPPSESDEFDERTSVILASVAYVNGTWETAFDKEQTTAQTFRREDNGQVTVSMMHKHDYFNYKEDHVLDAQVLELPFTNNDISMYMILPNEDDGLEEVESRLQDLRWDQVLSGFRRIMIHASVPKFRVHQTVNLKDALSEMGLEKMFSESRSKLSGVTSDEANLFIKEAVHKVFIEINENGCEAAAATGLGQEPVEISEHSFNMDRPFLFVIAEKGTENLNLLFVGRITNPSS